jgi:proliferating cell nuclear antigen
MSKLFQCKTNEGHIVKTLAELLQNNIKSGCYEINENGLFMRITDANKRILIDLQLNHENFVLYKVKKRISLGLNQSHFYKMLKSIKKKDSISLFIDESTPLDLGIEIVPKEKNRVTTSYVKIQNIQNLDIDLPSGYEKPILIPSNEFQKMIKDMNNIGNTIEISSKYRQVKFKCDAESVYKREVLFGEADLDYISPEILQAFDTEMLTRISKISGLNTTMQIHQSKGLPLKITSAVGNLGHIAIYLKSKEQIEEDEMHVGSDDEK